MLTVAIAAERSLVDHALRGNTFRAKVLPARVAQSRMFVTDYRSTIFADSARRAFAKRTFPSLVPDHLAGRALQDLPVGPVSRV